MPLTICTILRTVLYFLFFILFKIENQNKKKKTLFILEERYSLTIYVIQCKQRIKEEFEDTKGVNVHLDELSSARNW